MNSSHSTRRIRRQHAPEFKQELVALCQPGVSVSAVALAHGVNANLLRRWIHRYSGEPPSQAKMTRAQAHPSEELLVDLMGGLEGSATFAGDPLVIQKRLRDEWN